MNETSLAAAIRDMAAPLAASLGLSVWGVDAAFGKRAVVRVFVEGESGVDIDQCAELSRLLGLSLDVEDAIPGAYVLEVSSPGLERAFFTPEQLAGDLGKVVEVTLHAPGKEYPGRKKLIGSLTDAAGDKFALVPLDAGEEAVPARFAWDDIKKARRVHFLPEPENAPKGRKSTKPAKSGNGTNGAAGEDAPAA